MTGKIKPVAKIHSDGYWTRMPGFQEPLNFASMEVYATPPAATPAAPSEAQAFQARVQPWMLACFGEKIAADREERNHRFLEESLELVQACGCTASEAHQLVDYTFGRPVGEKAQEVGGVMVTLAALCLANGINMHAEGETELARIWTMVEKIRAKQAAKPKHSPLASLTQPTTVQQTKLDDAMQTLRYVESMLTNMQPHIPQACYPGRAAFIDNYVRPILERIHALLIKGNQ